MWQIAIILSGILGGEGECAASAPPPGCSVADDTPTDGFCVLDKCESGDAWLEEAIKKTAETDRGEELCPFRRYARHHDVDRDRRNDIFVVFMVRLTWDHRGDHKKYYVGFSGSRRRTRPDILLLAEGYSLLADCVHYDGKTFTVRITEPLVNAEVQPENRRQENFLFRNGHIIHSAGAQR